MADDATSTTETDAAAQTSDDSVTDQTAESTPTLEERLAAAQKVNADLERKLKRSDDNRTRVSELEAELAKLQGKEAEYEAAQEKLRLQSESDARANQKILKAEIRAAAAGKLSDPADALRFIDLSEFEVTSDGEIDGQAVARAVEDLIKSKPYLAAQGGRFQGGADGGARNDASKPSQLTREDMARMSPEQITAAEAEGRFDDLLGRK